MHQPDFFRRLGHCPSVQIDLATKPGIKQLRHPADVIDMDVGQKQVVYFVGWHPGNRAKGSTGSSPEAVPQSTRILTLSAEPGWVLYQVTETGDAVFCAEMGNFHAICYATFSLLDKHSPGV